MAERRADGEATLKCAIMQPTYIPWSGYFNLIASVEAFVFLDNVQFERQSWQSRNRILLQGREHLLVVPVERAPLSTAICDIVTSESRSSWRRHHWMTLKAAYGKARHGRELLDLLESIYASEEPIHLAHFNMAIIECLAQALRLPARFLRASGLDCDGQRTERLIEICEKLEADTYLSPRGSAEYLATDGFTTATAVNLEFQAFTPAPYKQYRAESFASHLSIVDVIANTGLAHARAYVSESA